MIELPTTFALALFNAFQIIYLTLLVLHPFYNIFEIVFIAELLRFKRYLFQIRIFLHTHCISFNQTLHPTVLYENPLWVFLHIHCIHHRSHFSFNRFNFVLFIMVIVSITLVRPY